MNEREKLNYINKLSQLAEQVMETADSDSDTEAMELLTDIINVVKEVVRNPVLPEKQKLTTSTKVDCLYSKHINFNKTQFDLILKLVESDLKKNMNVSDEVSEAEKLALTLIFLTSGESYANCNCKTEFSTAFISLSFPQVCEYIFNNLKGPYLQYPCNTEWERIAKNFHLKCQFPNCLGALGSKPLYVRKTREPHVIGTKNMSLIALVDANYRFIYVDIFNTTEPGFPPQCPLRTSFEYGNDFPDDALVNSELILPHVVVADESFPFRKHIMVPYPNNINPNEQERVYNERLERARCVVDHAFGILFKKFRVLDFVLSLNVETVKIATLACTALHNFLLENDDGYANSFKDIETENKVKISSFRKRTNVAAEQIRQQFLVYFNSQVESQVQ